MTLVNDVKFILCNESDWMVNFSEVAGSKLDKDKKQQVIEIFSRNRELIIPV